MSGNPQHLRQVIDEDRLEIDDHDDQVTSEPAAALSNASDARRRLEDYWAQKALDEELKNIDDWDETD